ncbi:MAG: class I SAM-dependent rRNA methyltransferase [Bacteroidales bacterium]
MHEKIEIKTDNFPKVVLKRGKELPIKKYHPWVFSGAIKYIEGNPEEGDVVEVYSSFDDFLGLGHFQENNTISVQVFSFEPYVPDIDFWKERLRRAFLHREQLSFVSGIETNAYRLVHGEADMLPGLIIDYYNGTIVFQITSMGMYKLRYLFAQFLQELYGERLISVYDKSAESLYKNTGVPCRDSFLLGEAGQETIKEANLFYRVDWRFGNRTGFFLDHREGRALLSRYAKDKKVLDLFCYSGSYTINALRAGAKMVHSVDTSQMAIDNLRENIVLNDLQGAHQESFVADAKKFMSAMPESTYDVIVIDPPTLAKTSSMESIAIKGYKKLNAQAMSKIKSGGLIFSFCSSKIIGVEQYRSIIYSAALDTGKKVSILRQIHQPEDHPISIYVPEREYLKGFVIRID